MFKLLTIVSLLLPVFSFAEVSFDGNKSEIKEKIMSVETPQASVSKAIKEQKEWTVMVFLNAKNDLEKFGIKDMNEMEMIGSSDKVNIVVEMGRIKGYDSSNGDWTGVRRYYITKDNDTNIINSTLISDMGDVDMGDYKSLVAFVKWAKEAYPAKRYLLVIWNHGSGWEKGFKSSVTKGISYDEASGNHINTPQLGMALKEIGYVDILNFDACLMQMAEVAYEIRTHVKYIVASEETEPGDGNTYNTFLDKLIAKPTMTPLELSKAMVDSFSSHYQSTGDGSTLSVIDAERMAGFLKKLNEFAYALSKIGDKNLVKTAASQTQSYAVSDNKDIYHFASLIYSQTTNSEVKTKAQDLMSFIKTNLVKYNKYTNSSSGWWGPTDYSNSNGIAIYLPSYSIANGYSELQWSKYSNWDEFLAWYIGKDATATTTPSTTTPTQPYNSWYEWLFGGQHYSIK
ncbi:MAG: hypothetical protein K6357_04700 [Elusimicrobiota bacterium]